MAQAERLQKVLSQFGIASRRQAEVMIAQGQVQVNGERAHLGQKVDLDQDAIEVNGQRLRSQLEQRCYILLNKPLGVVSTCADPRGRPTVLDLLPLELQRGQGIHPVGRLDQNSTGALLLTNDGALTYRLTHPKHQITKTYRVWVKGEPDVTTLERWRQGVTLEGRKTLPARVVVVSPMPAFPVQRPAYRQLMTCLEISMTEGRNRQIRRLAAGFGCPVIHLHRMKIGKISLKGLERGGNKNQKRWRYLKLAEIRYLNNV
ncbi:MAG: pseudouridine synthase [Cyanobacteria bacterium P01_F01_bin.42]